MKNNIKPKLYTLTTCLHCKAVKRFLKEHGIVFDCVEVDMLNGQERADVLSELMNVSGTCRFPTIVIGEKVIVGFSENKLREALGL